MVGGLGGDLGASIVAKSGHVFTGDRADLAVCFLAEIVRELSERLFVELGSGECDFRLLSFDPFLHVGAE